MALIGRFQAIDISIKVIFELALAVGRPATEDHKGFKSTNLDSQAASFAEHSRYYRENFVLYSTEVKHFEDRR